MKDEDNKMKKWKKVTEQTNKLILNSEWKFGDRNFLLFSDSQWFCFT